MALERLPCLRLGTAGMLGGRKTWWLGAAGILCGWALQRYSSVEHCRNTLRLGTARILCGWALQQRYSAAGHCRDTLWLALQEYVAIEHCSQAPGGGVGENITFLYSVSETVRRERVRNACNLPKPFWDVQDFLHPRYLCVYTCILYIYICKCIYTYIPVCIYYILQ